MKILLYDIETSPNLGYVWGKYQQDVISYKSEWQLLSFAYKWLGEKEVHCERRSSFHPHTERALVEKLWKLLDEADVIIAHNGDSFDNKKAQAKFVEFRMKPPSPFKSVDTKKVASRYFKFSTNKLDDLAQKLGVGRKLKHTGFDLWLGCMANDKKSWDLMVKYNKQDVVILEKVYKRLLPWMSNHPNMAHDGRPEVCPKCGGSRLKSKGIYKTATGTFRRYICLGCGGHSRSRLSIANAIKPGKVSL